MKKAIRINAEKQTLEVVEWDCLKDLQRHVGGLIERIDYPGAPGISVLVDEEGLFKDLTYGFSLRNGHQVLAGNGLIVGDNGMDFISIDIEPENAADDIEFIDLSDFD